MRIIMIDRKEDYLPKGRLIEELKAAYDEKSRGSVRNIFIISFTFSDKCGNITLAISYCFTLDYAPVAQGIEHRPPEAGAAVRIRPGVYFFRCRWRWPLWKKEKRRHPEAAGSTGRW